MSRHKHEHEEDHFKAKRLIESALGGKELGSDLPINNGPQLHRELLERADRVQQERYIPEAIKGVSFAYGRSRLGGEFAQREPTNSLESVARKTRADEIKSERLAKMGIKKDPIKGRAGGLKGKSDRK